LKFTELLNDLKSSWFKSESTSTPAPHPPALQVSASSNRADASTHFHCAREGFL